LAGKVETILFDKGYSVVRLDGDNLRHGLSGDLGFSDTDRSENLRRAGFVARLMFDQGHIVLCTFISPFRADRQSIRNLFPKDHFTEVFVKASLAVCELRDPKGLYREARLGHLPSMTGVDSPYEVPESPELTLDTELFQADALAQELVDFVIFHSKNSEKPIAK
jgi:adenylyl-sulfate kinase